MILLKTELKGCKVVRKTAHRFQLLHFRVESLLQTLEFLYVTQLSALHIIPYLSGMIFVTWSSLQRMAHTYGLCSVDHEVCRLREKAQRAEQNSHSGMSWPESLRWSASCAPPETESVHCNLHVISIWSPNQRISVTLRKDFQIQVFQLWPRLVHCDY